MSYFAKPRKNQGFTLIEVLVVVAIIALLVAILLPSLAKARAQARNTTCLANLHGFGLAMTGYSVTHKGQFPGQTVADEAGWTWVVARENGIKRQVDGDNNGTKEGYATLNVHQMEFFHCPERKSINGAAFVDYMQNTMNPDGPTLDASTGRKEWDISGDTMNVDNYKRPSDVAYILDAASEDENIFHSGDGGLTLKQARQNFYQYVNGSINGDGLIAIGGIDAMDARAAIHMPQGVGMNNDEKPSFRRIARKMHLNRFTNAMFLDGHVAGLQMRADTDLENLAYWLRLMGLKDPTTAAGTTPYF